MVDVASHRLELEVELVELNEFDLPFFNECMSNLHVPSEDPRRRA